MVNKVILLGNVGKDPEVKYFDNDVAVASFSIATSETYKDKSGEKQTKTEWHNISAWRGLAKLAENYIKKGTQLYIEGKLTTRSWDDKDGNKRYTTEIVANTIQMLGKKSDNTSAIPTPSVDNAPQEMGDSGLGDGAADDLPF
jgi:single-strand DNA-binding protein